MQTLRLALVVVVDPVVVSLLLVSLRVRYSVNIPYSVLQLFIRDVEIERKVKRVIYFILFLFFYYICLCVKKMFHGLTR